MPQLLLGSGHAAATLCTLLGWSATQQCGLAQNSLALSDLQSLVGLKPGWHGACPALLQPTALSWLPCRC